MKKLLNGDYPYDGAIKWNINSIPDSIKEAKKTKTLPDFDLERVEIHPTSLCQYKCPFCYGINFKNKERVDLPLDLIEKNILKNIREDKKLSKYNPIIILAGLYSEPLVHMDSIELIKLIGMYKFRFSLYTNGVLMNEKVMEALCETTKKTKNKQPNYVSFNITASILHKQYDSLVAKLKKLIKIKNEKKAPLQINIPILIDGDSLSKADLNKIQKKMLDIGVDKIRYSVPQTPLSSQGSIDIKNVGPIKELGKRGKNKVYVRSKSGKQFDKCFVMANTVSIDNQGNVYPCSQTSSGIFSKLSYGSIKDKKLSSIWNSKEHKILFYTFDEIPIYCRCNPADNQFNTICSSFD
ncbi:hypothetical protein C4544_05445 [candidate division WS5 bacterium]|uniref:Uncharacterized protein n=1 Tax=candidate division WS5 bacterium TaxID=2093353 RepID=A0A419DB25_9BACT|nr:MAG: hypothetical protein C4544_05445 [candidate division WS5 bacterium]